MMGVLMFPQFDPVLIQLGPFAIRWYALAYIGGLLLGWRIMRRLVRLDPPVASAEQVDDFLTWATLGVVLGGRLGYVLFYQPGFYLTHPMEALAVWQGGMSFHGGALGVIVATAVFCYRNGLSFRGFGDRVCVVVPIGLGLGRIANFINGELWGRIAPDTLPWAMIFPQAGPEPRHPSQLYQAGMEGLLLFALLAFLCTRPGIRARFGTLSGVFPGRLRRGADHRRALPAAGRLPRLPVGRRDDGADPVDPDDPGRAWPDPGGAQAGRGHRLTMLRLDRFMADANARYYAAHDPFRDFTTAPEISQVFGEILGLWAAVVWDAMGRPDPVLLIELGPGRGTLMADALRAVRRVAPGFAAALRVHLVEASPRLRAIQRQAVPEATWHDAVDTLPPGPAIALANEFLDALPIRQFIRRGGGWMERWVDGGMAVERPADPPGRDAAEGEVVEVNDAARDVARWMAGRDAALILDYGPARSAPGESLQALRDGRPADPFAAPGEADLTAHVDFQSVADAARDAGAVPFGPVKQGPFLARLGLFQRTGMLARTQPPARAAAMIQAAQRLAEPDRMGGLFKALAICKPGLPTPPGFEA